jgi:hypothetical protein
MYLILATGSAPGCVGAGESSIFFRSDNEIEEKQHK